MRYLVCLFLVSTLAACKTENPTAQNNSPRTEKPTRNIQSTADSKVSISTVNEHPRTIAMRIFQRLTGTPILLSDPRLEEMETLIAKKNAFGAAAIATKDDNFLNVTIKQWATPWMNRDQDQLAFFNDGVATVIGLVRDWNPDAGGFREVLTTEVTYGAPAFPEAPEILPDENDHYEFLEEQRVNLAQNLVTVPQTLPEKAGLLTTRAWGAAHLIAGTNRRATQKAIEEFLCRPLLSLADTTLPDTFVRRDVSRMPGGLPSTFKSKCVGCHAPMDALGGAFAKFDYVDEELRHHDDGGENRDGADDVEMFQGGVAFKMNRAPNVYPSGRVTVDTYWKNLWVGVSDIKWEGSIDGYGVKEFGRMLVSTDAFFVCMAKKAFKTICSREVTPGDDPTMKILGDKFRESNANIRELFQYVAIEPSCTKQNREVSK